MARSYGQITSAIWTNPDFRKLTATAQRAYLMLVTQADISSAGTLSITVRRWSQYAVDTPSDALSEDLSELASGRFVVVDFDTEELLVRKFVKWDNGYGNERRQLAIRAAAEAVVSQRIRGVLAVELSKLGVPHGLCDALSDSPSDAPCDTPRVVVTEVSTFHNPEPEPETGNLTPSARADADRLCHLLAELIEGNGSKRPVVTDRWLKAARLMLDVDKRTEEQIERAIRWCQGDEFWRSNVMSMPKLREKYDQLRLAAQRTGRTGPSTDSKVAATLAMAQRLETDTPRELTDGRYAS